MDIVNDNDGFTSQVVCDFNQIAGDLVAQHHGRRWCRIQELHAIGVIDQRDFAAGDFCEHLRAVNRQLRIALDATANEFRKLAQRGRAVVHGCTPSEWTGPFGPPPFGRERASYFGAADRSRRATIEQYQPIPVRVAFRPGVCLGKFLRRRQRTEFGLSDGAKTAALEKPKTKIWRHHQARDWMKFDGALFDEMSFQMLASEDLSPTRLTATSAGKGTRFLAEESPIADLSHHSRRTHHTHRTLHRRSRSRRASRRIFLPLCCPTVLALPLILEWSRTVFLLPCFGRSLPLRVCGRMTRISSQLGSDKSPE